MKKFSFVIGLALALALGLAFVSCDNGTTGGGGGIRKSGPGANLIDRLEYRDYTRLYIWFKGGVRFDGGYLNRDIDIFVNGEDVGVVGGYSYDGNTLLLSVGTIPNKPYIIGQSYTIKVVYTASSNAKLYSGGTLVGSFTIEQTVVYRW